VLLCVTETTILKRILLKVLEDHPKRHIMFKMLTFTDALY